MKYDDICIPTDEIYMRVRGDGDEFGKYERLIRVSGFKFMFCGREIGVHQSSLKRWRATDLKTGIKINLHDYATRGHLIRGMLNHIDVYQKVFSEPEKLAEREIEFQLIKRKMEEKKWM